MKNNKIFTIISREFFIRVRKKSFIITTILTPLLFIAMMAVPILMEVWDGDKKEAEKVGILDESGIVAQQLKSNSKVEYVILDDVKIEDIKQNFDKFNSNLIAYISPLDTITYDVSCVLYSKKQSGLDIEMKFTNDVEKIIRDYKIEKYNIAGLDDIINKLNKSLKCSSYIISEDGSSKESHVGVSMGIGYVCAFLIYIFIFLFGQMVLKGIIEEKSTRIVEVLVSSVKPFELMMGKIIGIAGVALVQFAIWAILILVLVPVVSSQFAPTDVATMAQMPSNVPVEAISDSSFIAALLNVNFSKIFILFVLYFVLGYLLYASMFAAVGSAVDNEADTQQLLLPVTLPLILGLFIMLHTFQHPDSTLSFWGSIIPFTSPMVMMARAAYDVPFWEIALSLGLLLITFTALVYLSAKIYRIGILTYGKKPNWKTLSKWIKY